MATRANSANAPLGFGNSDSDIPQIQKQIHFFLRAFLADSTARLVCFRLARSAIGLGEATPDKSPSQQIR